MTTIVAYCRWIEAMGTVAYIIEFGEIRFNFKVCYVGISTILPAKEDPNEIKG